MSFGASPLSHLSFQKLVLSPLPRITEVHVPQQESEQLLSPPTHENRLLLIEVS
jgi:hypothetical protein